MMPIHDWTKVPAGKFHDFHCTWITMLKMAFMRRALPDGYVAEMERTESPPTRNIAIRDAYNDELVAVIEIVSPGNKDGRAKMDAFKDKCEDLIRNGIHLLVVDLFPPGRFDPLGVHRLVWESFGPADEDLQPGCDRLLASYRAGIFPEAYVEPVSLGAEMKSMALFLTEGTYVECPLQHSYDEAFAYASGRVHEALAGTNGAP